MINCYANGNATGYRGVGGFIGNTYRGVFQNCYASGVIDGNYYVGGLIGERTYISDETVINCYYLLNGSPVTFGGTGLSKSAIKTKASFISWDFVGDGTDGFNDIWRMCVDGVDYPRLSWEFSQNGDFACVDGVDFADLQSLAEHWLLTESTDPATFSYACDANGDGQISFEDYAVLAKNWL